MKAAAFDYVKPKSLAQALTALAEGGDDAQLAEYALIRTSDVDRH